MMYKIHNGLVAMDPQDHMTPIRRQQSTPILHQLPPILFFPRTIRDRNRLPETTVQAPNLNAFKRRLSNPNECEHKNPVASNSLHVHQALHITVIVLVISSSHCCLYFNLQTLHCTITFTHSLESSCMKEVGDMEVKRQVGKL